LHSRVCQTFTASPAEPVDLPTDQGAPTIPYYVCPCEFFPAS